MWRGISLHNQIGEMLSQGPKYGKVHSVFRRTVNLTDEDENMISLVTRKMDYAPISICLLYTSLRLFSIQASKVAIRSVPKSLSY